MTFSKTVSHAFVTACAFVLWAACQAAAFGAGSATSRHIEISSGRSFGALDIGGKYSGLQFRKGRPLPSRISFFYPVGMTIDLSPDSLHRDESLPLAIGVKRGDGGKSWLGHEAWNYSAGPHRAEFSRSEDGIEYRIRYEFSDELPGFLLHLTAVNKSARPVPLEIYTHLRAQVRPNGGPDRVDLANTDYDPDFQYAWIKFESDEAHKPCIIAQSISDPPSDWTLSAGGLSPGDTGTSAWISSNAPLGKQTTVEKKGLPFVAYSYRDEVAPGDSFMLIQAYWGAQQADRRDGASKLQKGWAADIEAYRGLIDSMAVLQSLFKTGDAEFDRSVQWAKGVLASNHHFIGNTVEPASSAVEALWYSSKEVVTAALGATPFDLNGVFNAIRFISDHAREDSLIPRSIFWQDEGFALEYPDSGDWTNAWFIMANASYLRHSSDTSSCSRWYRLAVRSVDTLLAARGPDNLIHGPRIDWWDGGDGDPMRASALGTALAVRALRDFCFLTVVLGRDASKLPQYEAAADAMESALRDKLWNKQAGWYFDMKGGNTDGHRYAGALLVPWLVFDDGAAVQPTAAALAAAAQKELFVSPLGIANVAPADRAAFGLPSTSLNGGVWGQANAWYAMTQALSGKSDDALKTLTTTLGPEQVLKSRNGSPGMYKERNADKQSPQFGEINNTSYTTTASWFLAAAYTLAGFAENSWNLGVRSAPPAAWKNPDCAYTFGLSHDVTITGRGNRLRSFKADGAPVPSMVMPVEIMTSKKFAVEFGAPKSAYLESVNAVLHAASLDHGKLSFEVSSFEGHAVNAVVVSPSPLRRASVDGAPVELVPLPSPDGVKAYRISFKAAAGHQMVTVN